MAYASSLLNLVDQSISAPMKRWTYNSGDTQATVGASSYISDAVYKGVAAGDQIVQYVSSTNELRSYLVKTVRSSVSSGSADLSSGMSLSS